MAKMKFDIQGIVNNVKSLISPLNIPEAAQDKPIPYLLGELSKVTKELADLSTKQADAIAKMNNLLGAIYQEFTGSSSSGTSAPVKSEDETH